MHNVEIQLCTTDLGHGFQLSTVGEKLLAASTPRVRASRTPQSHLNARRSALPRGVVLQVIRDNVGKRANEYRRVVERFRSLQVNAELCVLCQ